MALDVLTAHRRLALQILEAMSKKRDELIYHGVAAVVIIDKESVGAFRSGELVNLNLFPVCDVNQVDRISTKDPNFHYNPAAAVFGKLWQMVRTGMPSGPADVIGEESGHHGGLVVEWVDGFGQFWIFLAFSGAPENVDLMISEAGRAKIVELR